MSELHTDTVVHYFDTEMHRIACGIRGFDRSTKHSRAVTCPSCVALLHDRAGERAVAVAVDAAAAHA